MAGARLLHWVCSYLGDYEKQGVTLTDWLAEIMFFEGSCCWLNRSKTGGDGSCSHGCRTMSLFLEWWTYFYSHNLGNTGPDQTQSSTKGCLQDLTNFSLSMKYKKDFILHLREKKARYLGTSLLSRDGWQAISSFPGMSDRSW